MKIVIRTPNWIGDVVLALPAIENLKNNFPSAGIWLAAKDWVRDLFPPNDYINGVIPLPQSNNFQSYKASLEKLKEMDFETSLVLTNSFASAFLFYMAGIPNRWGYRTDGRGLFLTKGVSPKEPGTTVHQVQFYLNLISGLELRTTSPDIAIPVSDEEKDEAAVLLRSHGVDLSRPLVLLHPGAAFGPAKQWPVSSFARLASLLQEENKVDIGIAGSPNERGLVEELSSLLKKKPAVMAGQTSLRQLLGVMSHSSLCIANDSGPMHMANALKVPVIGIFGPTDPSVTGPFQQPSTVIKKETVCWPCSYRTCPYDHRCMTAISPEEVFLAGRQYLE